jgi:hypothetical protein
MGPERYPSALGARGRKCWAEIWGIIGPQIDFVLAGRGSTWDVERLVPVTRHGRREDVGGPTATARSISKAASAACWWSATT